MAEMLEDLKGDRPKILGFDYYNVIYVTGVLLSLSMLFVFFTIDDPQLKKMVLLQGALSLGLMFSLMYYQKRLAERKQKEKEERKKRKIAKELQADKKKQR
jgi:hypothetical protein